MIDQVLRGEDAASVLTDGPDGTLELASTTPTVAREYSDKIGLFIDELVPAFEENYNKAKSMAQLAYQTRDQMTQYKTTKVDELVAAEELGIIQKQIFVDKALNLIAEHGVNGIKKLAKEKSVMVNKDNHALLDGNHRWLACMMVDPTTLMGVEHKLKSNASTSSE